MLTDEQLSAMPIADLMDLHRKAGALIAKSHDANRNNAVIRARELCAAFGIEPLDVFGLNTRTSRKARKPLIPKYRDPATDKTWVGVGKTPRWLVGKNLDDFKIPQLVG